METDCREECVLLFSGGRDSTIAAMRLGARVKRLTLLTVTEHEMIGFDRVTFRVNELRAKGLAFDWVVARRPVRDSAAQTCLGCHAAALGAAISYALTHEIATIAVGYSRYQEHWPEQSPEAVASLRTFMTSMARELLLPVQDLSSKEDAEAALCTFGLKAGPLEQTCRVGSWPNNIAGSDWQAELRDALDDAWVFETEGALQERSC